MRKSSLSSASFVFNAVILIRLQLVNRLLSFVLNTIVIRLISPAALGLATIKLDLFLKTILSLSREGPRLALLRYPRPTGRRTARIRWLTGLLHLSRLALTASPVPMAVLLFAYSLTVPTEVEQGHWLGRFWLAMTSLITASLIELIAEPFYQVLREDLLGLRAQIESAAMIAKTVTVLLLCWTYRTNDDGIGVVLLAFPLGQLVYSLVLAVGLGYSASRQYPELIKLFLWNVKEQVEKGRMDEASTESLTLLVEHAHAMKHQSAFKYILAQGDMWLISLLTTLPGQGVYAVVSNYGSIVCRILLEPTDEAALVFFSAAGGDESFKQLTMLLRIYQLVGSLILLLGPPLSRPLADLLFGDRWRDTSMHIALRAYCLLLPVMAVSGVLEAFVHAKIQDQNDLRRLRLVALLSTGLFVGVASWLTSRLGPVGMILGNVVNFGMRSATSLWFVRSWCTREGLVMEGRRLLMRPALLGILLIFGMIFYTTERMFSQVYHTLAVLAQTPIILALIWMQERPQLLEIRSLLFGEKCHGG